MSNLPINFREYVRDGINDKIRDFLIKNGKAIFFKEGIKLSNGSELISLTCNSSNTILTTKKMSIESKTLYSVDMGIVEEVITLLEKGSNTIECLGWIAESNEDDSWFEVSNKPYFDKDICFLSMAADAIDFTKQVISDKYDDIKEGLSKVKMEVGNNTIVADWLTYKLVKFKAFN